MFVVEKIFLLIGFEKLEDICWAPQLGVFVIEALGNDYHQLASSGHFKM